MQLKFKHILNIVVILFLNNIITAQNKEKIISDLTNTFVKNKQEFIDKPILNVLKEIQHQIKGYSVYSKSASSIKIAKVSTISLYFLPKESEMENALRGELSGGNEKECIILNIEIKNYESFPLISDTFPNSTDGDNWNDYVESSILKSGIIVEDLNLMVN